MLIENECRVPRVHDWRVQKHQLDHVALKLMMEGQAAVQLLLRLHQLPPTCRLWIRGWRHSYIVPRLHSQTVIKWSWIFTHHHAQGTIQWKIGQCTTQHRVSVVSVPPGQVWDGDHEALHEGDWQRIWIHEHGRCHNETPTKGSKKDNHRNHPPTFEISEGGIMYQDLVPLASRVTSRQ